MNYLAVHRAHSWVMMAFLRTKATVLEFATRRVGPSTDFIALNRFLLRCSFGFSGILPAEAELMYINEVERLDGFGQEIFPVKVAPPCPCFSCLRTAQAFGKPVLLESRGPEGLAFSFLHGIS